MSNSLTLRSVLRAAAIRRESARQCGRLPARQISVMLVCLACGACSDRIVIDTKSLQLPPSRWTLINTGTLKIKSWLAQICVPLPAGYTMHSDAGRATIHDRDGKSLQLSERFIGANGETVNGDGPGGLYQGHVWRACFYDRDDTIGREFTAIELKSSDTLTVRPVEWETGKRYGTP